MTITQLEYIIAVDTYRSFSQAAEKCFVTQPTLSMQIQKLEDQFGVLLFDRQKKPVMTTEIGEQIIEQARTIIRESKKIKSLIADHKGEVSGELHVGILPTIAPYLLPLFLPSFLEKFTGVQLNIEELTTDEIISRLNKDQLDIGILATPFDKGRFNEIPLYQEKMLAYVSPLHPFFTQTSIDLTTIEPKDIWLLSKGHCFRNQALQLCNMQKDGNASAHFTFESGSIETIIKILDHHRGITIVPEMAGMYLNTDQKKGLKPFSKNEPGRQISIVSRRSFLKQNTIQALQESVMDKLPKGIKENVLEILAV
ncbi:MAG: LysR substrate-binding domain-containing protein [Bacteroidota bacterium]